jgi:manganese transport protein
MKNRYSRYIGPGPLIAAAFIGPGTVTVCTVAGVRFGYELIWALLLSMIVTVVLQEMASRIGLQTSRGLASLISGTLEKGIIRYFSILLILVAIVLGNAAYEAGNISGGTMGLTLFVEAKPVALGKLELNPVNLLIGTLAWLLLMSGSFKKVTFALTLLVILMSLAFIINALIIRPDFFELVKGIAPSIQSNNIIPIVSLIGTTVVPYNLFLHSSLVSKRWSSINDLKFARIDTLISVVLGIFVSISILVAAAASGVKRVDSALDMAVGLEPLMGSFAKYFIGFGLFAAGMSSAITAPLAGALVVTGIFGWSSHLSSAPMRWSFSCILGLGLLFASLGIKPVQLIALAQFTNGLLLPLVSSYLIWLANSSKWMKNHKNRMGMNLVALSVWLITLLLGGISIGRVLGMF